MTTHDFTAPAAASQPSLDRRRKGLVALLAVLLLLTLLVGLAAISGYFYLRNNRSVEWTWQDPLAAVDPSRVRADLAVITLLDQPAGSLVQQAVLASEPDTAYAILVNSVRSSDAERSGSAQLVGRAFEQVPAQDLAALSYQQMLDIAALSPTLADPMRPTRPSRPCSRPKCWPATARCWLRCNARTWPASFRPSTARWASPSGQPRWISW